MAENARTSKLANFQKKFVRFFKDIRTELKKVIWPTRKQLTNSTISVLLICLLVGIVIWVSDLAFGQLVAWTLRK
jgi:preprotein translocase subunit SecE